MQRIKNKGKKCNVEACNNPAYAKGYCEKHYNRLYDGKDPHTYHPPAFDEDKFINKQFCYLTILKFVEPKYSGTQINRRCLCKCMCGVEKVFYLNNILGGYSQSCGCKPYQGCKNNISIKELLLYRLWAEMMKRCYNPRNTGYKNYGGRGIDVYENWHNTEIFINDIKQLLGDKPTGGYSIDRIDNDKGYYPNNIRWATSKQQMNNTRYSNVLTAKVLGELTGYTRERIRQLTHKTSSDNGSEHPLMNFIKDEIKGEKNTHYIYKPEAIQFLINRRENPMPISTLFVPFNYQKFLEDNILTLKQLATTLNIDELTLRNHLKDNRIRKEHYYILQEKGYDIKSYLIKSMEIV